MLVVLNIPLKRGLICTRIVLISRYYQKNMLKAITAKKRLGQNFLTNKNKIKEIVSVLDIKKSDTIIEIGPGQGELTTEIVKALPRKIIAIEKDEVLAERLRNSVEIHGNSVEIISGDALKIIPSLVENCKLKIENYKIVGNIPYYITGFLLRIIGELKNKPRLIVLTVQKEVALRIAAEPPKMNLLAASIQFWAKTEVIGFIPKRDFFPEPKVDSAIIRLTPINSLFTKGEAENYYGFIKRIFKQPRKTVLNNLSSVTKNKGDAGQILEENGITSKIRPQDLSVHQMGYLASKLASKIEKNR